MRHAVFGKRLGRDTNSRKALLNNIASDLFYRGRVTTTLAKAKFAKNYVEKLITSAKNNRLQHNRRLASLVTDRAFAKLTREIAPGFLNRQGGYTRIIKLNMRFGDAALLARLELLEYEKVKKPATAKSAPLDHPRGGVEAKPGEHPGGEQRTDESVPSAVTGNTRKSESNQRKLKNNSV